MVRSSPQSNEKHHEIVVENKPTVVVADPARISWGAIFAGAACGLAIYLILGLTGLAFGLGVVDPAEGSNPLAGVPTGVGIWWSISAVAAFFAAGLIAGRLAGWQRNTAGALHGMTVGAITLLLVSYVATSAIGSTLTGAAGAVASLFTQPDRRNVQVTVNRGVVAGQPAFMRRLNEAGQQASGDARSQQGPQGQQGVTMQQVRNAIERASNSGASQSQSNYFLANYLQFEAMQAIRQEAGRLIGRFIDEQERKRIVKAVEATYADVVETPSDARQDIRELIQLLLSNDGVLGPEDRAEAKQILVERLGVEKDQAERILQRWQRRYEQAVNRLQELVKQANTQLSEIAREQKKALGEAANEVVGSIRKVVNKQEQKKTLRIAEATIDDIVESPGDAATDLQHALDRLFGKDGVWSEEDLNELRSLLKKQTGLSEQDVDRVINRWQKRYQEAVARTKATYQKVKEEAVEASDAALDTLAITAGWASFTLFLSLASSTAGGMLGRPSGPSGLPVFSRRRDDEDDDYNRKDDDD